MTRLEKIRTAHGDMNELMTKLSKFGAFDTEPYCHYQDAIRNAIFGKPFTDLTADQWELYSIPGVEVAAKAMNAQTRKIVNLIMESKIGDVAEINSWAGSNL